MDFDEKILGLSKNEILQRVGDMRQLAYVELQERADGAAKGCRQASFRTARGLQFDVLVDRAMDIPSLYYKGRNLVWRSPVGESHPTYYEPEGDEWERNFFGGLLTTCGLTNFGPASEEGDVFHGRISNRPAKNLSVTSEWREEDYVLAISGEVKQSRLHGENLTLRRRIETSLKEKTIRINDRVKNDSFRQTPHKILYHINLGYPLLDEGSKLELDSIRTRGVLSEKAKKELDEYDEFHAPLRGFEDRVYEHKIDPSDDGYGTVKLMNPDIGDGLGLEIRFRESQLPYLIEWKYLNQGEYVLGLEPANCPFKDKNELRENGELPILEPQEAREYEVEIEVFD
ncbi:MAG: aldose 1-epimerase family protein [Candidatus Hadarchaeota archaeon]